MLLLRSVTHFFICVHFVLATGSNQTFDTECYGSPLPNIVPVNDSRPIPWGNPGIKFTNGTTCCSTVEEVRARIGAVDAHILKLLGERASYVREAGRFKPDRPSVFNQAASDAVIQRAFNASVVDRIPKTIAVGVYEKILEVMLKFEYCSYDSYLAEP